MLPGENENAVVEARHLTKRYGKNEALRDVSFTIRERETVGFIGPNGAGKSTTMNILSGYLAPTGGKVRICGIDLLADPLQARRQIGYLPEIPPLYMDMTVEEQVCFASALSGVKKRGRELHEYAMQLCEKTHVTQMRRRLIKNLSKGYRQRVAVAQLLAGDPKILILDEPTVGLDPRQIREFRDLFLELGRDHTIIFSSHILSEINSICNRIFIFDQGKLMAQGRPDELQRRLSGADTIRVRLRGNWQEAQERIRSIEGVSRVRDVSEDAAAFRDPGGTQSPEAEAHAARDGGEGRGKAGERELLICSAPETDITGALNRQIRLAGCEILLMQPEQLSLEDMYLEVTDGER